MLAPAGFINVGGMPTDAGIASGGKDAVIDQMQRALKLFRRCKMIESELEMQFKLTEYLVELYLSTKMPIHCLRVVE